LIFSSICKQHSCNLKREGISQEDLAWKTGFELSQIGRIERGEVNTSISHIAAFAKALKVLPKDLFDF